MMERVSIVSDGDGHDYVIPHHRTQEFYDLLNQFEDSDGDAENFIEEFEGYMIGGSTDLIKIYADFNDLFE